MFHSQLTRENWLRRFNNAFRQKYQRRIVRIHDDDPRWLKLGDYCIVDTKRNAVVCANLSFRDIAPEILLRDRSKGPNRRGRK